MGRSRLKFTVICSAFLLAGSGFLRGGVIINTFGAGHSFENVWTAACGSCGGAGDAAEFTPTASGNVGTIDLVLGQAGTGTTATLVLANDNSGSPGTAIETYSVVGLTASPAVITLTSSLQPSLSAGTDYWLELFPTDNATSIDWYLNNQGAMEVDHATGTTAFNVYPATWTINSAGPMPALDILTPQGVPEPAATMPTCLALGMGVGFACLRRR